jgi:hypothetical protein
MPGIYCSRVTLIEGNVDELVSIALLAKDMRGFVIVFPTSKESNENSQRRYRSKT